MSEFEAAHYSSMISGGAVWLVLLLLVVIAAAMAQRGRPAPAASTVRAAWVGPVLISAAVLAFFAAAPFVIYGAGPNPSARGISLVVANQAGYATSFLLLGLLSVGVARILGARGWATKSFAIGTAAGLALGALAAAQGGYPWLIAPP